jgi:hypothetical protein
MWSISNKEMSGKHERAPKLEELSLSAMACGNMVTT